MLLNKKVKIIISIFVLILLLVLVLFLIQYLFTRFVFNDGLKISKEYYYIATNQNINYGCDQINDALKKNLIINFKFDYPLVTFRGGLVIRDNKITIKSVSRIIYAGKYEKQILIEKICYDAKSRYGKMLNLSFYFIDESNKYSFSMLEDYPILNYDEVEILIKYDDHLSGNIAVIKPIK